MTAPENPDEHTLADTRTDAIIAFFSWRGRGAGTSITSQLLQRLGLHQGLLERERPASGSHRRGGVTEVFPATIVRPLVVITRRHEA